MRRRTSAPGTQVLQRDKGLATRDGDWGLGILAILAILVLLSACATGRGARKETSWPVASTVADSIVTERLADGVRLHHLVRNAVPLRAHVLDLDLDACVSVRALKGSSNAVGRTTTSALLAAIPAADAPIAAVNADFFSLTAPLGVPVGALVQDGRVVAGPVNRPVLAFDAQGRPSIVTLTVTGVLVTSRGRVDVSSWNRPSANAVGIVDASWGQVLDSLSRPGAMQLVPLGDKRYRIAALPPSHNGLAQGDTLMLVGSARASLIERDTVRVDVALAPVMPLQAVGGFPLLVRDSVIVPTVDTDGAVGFRGVNPRTAAGFAANGRRLLLVVIDGRQAGYSAGTTTRETAMLLRDLGAREAVNLDGGGSTAMVVRDWKTGTQRVVNKPSDAVGERAVGDALGVLASCGKR